MFADRKGQHLIHRSIQQSVLPKVKFYNSEKKAINAQFCFTFSSITHVGFIINQYIIVEAKEGSAITAESVIDDASKKYRRILWDLAYKKKIPEVIRIAQHTSKLLLLRII
jgi:hypothetical protein